MPMPPVGVPRPVVPPAGPPQPVAPPAVQGPRLAPNLNTNVGSGASDQEKVKKMIFTCKKTIMNNHIVCLKDQ